MRRVGAILLIALTILITRVYAETPPVTFTISTPQNIYKTTDFAHRDSDIPIETILQNHSDNIIGFEETDSDCDFGVTVRNTRGYPAPLTENGKHECTAITHSIIRSLKPGDGFKERINIGQLYDLNVAGKYTIQLHRAIWLDPDKDKSESLVKSNVITINAESSTHSHP